MRPVASIPALWALSVELLRAVGEALRPKHRANPVLEAEELPARIIYIDDGINSVSLGCNSTTLQVRITSIDIPVTANTRLNDFG